MRAPFRSVLLVIVSAPWLVAWSFFDPFHENVEKGNREASSGDQEKALGHYGEAARADPSSPIPDFNRGVLLSRSGEVDQALDAFRAAAAAQDTALASDALYNLGNVYLDSEQFEPAIDSYFKSLDLDPTDADARRNLEIALRRMEEQQQQQQQQPQDQQDQKEQENQGEQPKPDEPQEDDQQKNQDESQPDQPKPDDEEQPQPEPEKDRLSREDAERLLNAVQSDELKVLEQLQQQAPPKGSVTRDW